MSTTLFCNLHRVLKGMSVRDRVEILGGIVQKCECIAGASRFQPSLFGIGFLRRRNRGRKKPNDQTRVGREIVRLIEHDLLAIEVSL